MKFCAYILAFYLILLAAVPCCTIDNCPDEQTEQTAGHERTDEDCGTCSPFFSCEGCAAATGAYEPIQFDFAIEGCSPIYTQYQQASLSEADLDFWQPPKIG
jgi:hypothetical protein